MRLIYLLQWKQRLSYLLLPTLELPTVSSCTFLKDLTKFHRLPRFFFFRFYKNWGQSKDWEKGEKETRIHWLRRILPANLTNFSFFPCSCKARSESRQPRWTKVYTVHLLLPFFFKFSFISKASITCLFFPQRTQGLVSSAEDLGVARDQDNEVADLTASSPAVDRAALYKLVTHSNTSRLEKSVSEIYHRAPAEVI